MFAIPSFAQNDTTINQRQLHQVITYEGVEYLGYIINEDEREILIEIPERGKIYIPQYVIKEINPISEKDYTARGEFVGEDRFSTRYFITANGLPVRKGDHYILWNLYGPEFQFGLSKNFGFGIMTSWLASPIAFTTKYSFQFSEKFHGAVGAMVGTMGWIGLADSESGGGGALPFLSLSTGNRTRNLTFSGGYGTIWQGGFSDPQGRALMSVAGMVKVSRKLSLVFDSFIVLQGAERTRTVENIQYDQFGQPYTVYTTEKYNPAGLALLIPGLRWHQGPGKAFQFGFTGIVYDQEIVPFPVPMVQWFRSL